MTDPLLAGCPTFQRYALGSAYPRYATKVTAAVLVPADNQGVPNFARILANNSRLFGNVRHSTAPLEESYRAYRDSTGDNWLHPEVRTNDRLQVGWLWREAVWAMTNGLSPDNYAREHPYIGCLLPLSIFQLSEWELIRSTTLLVSTTTKVTQYAYRRNRNDSPVESRATVDNAPAPDRRG